MVWAIKIGKTAEKHIFALDSVMQKRIVSFLRSRVDPENPRKTGKPLKGHKKNLWRYRTGDYRIICDLQDDKSTVLVLAIGHRSKVYKS